MLVGLRFRTVFLTGLVFSVACGGQSCSCVEPIKGGFPTAERRPNAIQLRAAQGMFDFLEQNGATIFPSLLGMGSVFNVPPQCGSNKVCCATPAPMCRLQPTIKTTNLTPTAPNVLKVSIDLELKTLDNLPIEFLGSKCFVSIDTTRSGSRTMNISTDVSFPVNASTLDTELKGANSAVTGLDTGDIKLDEPGSGFLCTIVGLPGIENFVVNTLTGEIANTITSTISETGCMECKDKSDCNNYASACTDGKCVMTGGACVQEVGLSGRMNVGNMLASFSPGLNAHMDVHAVLGGYASANTGLSLGMLGGGLAAPHSPCVPMMPKPTQAAITPSASFTGDVVPGTTTPYHLGVGVHRTHLDTLGFAAWDSGALCLRVGTPSVDLLTSRTFTVIIPSLDDLTHGKEGPMFLVLRPEKPPTFTLGKGTFKDEGGKRVIDEPLMKIAVPTFNIDFYAFVDERFVRIMTLTADLDIPVSLDVDMAGKLLPVLGDFTKAFTNVKVSNSELLAEAPSDLAKTFPTLLGLAGGQLGSALGPIDLPSIMGLSFKPKVITATDPDAQNALSYLALFLDMVPPGQARIIYRFAETRARLARLAVPSTPGFAVSYRIEPEPVVTLDLDGDGQNGKPLEYQWMVDDAGWSPFSESRRIEITHPLFWIQGKHTVKVRAREVGLPSTLDPEPAVVPVTIDTVAPEGKLAWSGGVLSASASDGVFKPHELTWRHRVGAGAWSEWHALDEGANVDKAEVPKVQAEVRDPIGNTGILDFHGRTTTPSSGGCGCEVGAAPTTGTGPIAVVCLAVAFLIARRRRFSFSLMFTLTFLVAGCNSGLSAGDYVSEQDEVGRWSDVAAAAGVFHVSAYDSSMGDLVYARITDVAAPIKWQYVDGIEPGTNLEATPEQPRYGITDPGPDVGTYTSIAVNRKGEPRISYYDVTSNQVKLALGTQRFTTHAIDTGSGAVLVGLHTSLVLDAEDRPIVAYMATGMPGMPNAFKSELRIARASTPEPKSSADWKISVVDSTAIACGGLCPAGKACVVPDMVNMMPNGDPAKSTCQPTTTTCTMMCGDGQACIGGTCTDILVNNKAPDLHDGTGLFTQLAVTSQGVVAVYYDKAQGDLKMARQNGESWAVSFIDGNDPATDVGQFASMAAAADGTLHVAYVDAISDRLLYKTVAAGGAPAMAPEVIDDGQRPDGPRPVGSGAAIALEGGTPRVVYQDQQRADLMDAKKSGAGWTKNAIKTDAVGYGWWPRLVESGGRLFLGQLVYDRARAVADNSALGRFVLTAMP